MDFASVRKHIGKYGGIGEGLKLLSIIRNLEPLYNAVHTEVGKALVNETFGLFEGVSKRIFNNILNDQPITDGDKAEFKIAYSLLQRYYEKIEDYENAVSERNKIKTEKG